MNPTILASLKRFFKVEQFSESLRQLTRSNYDVSLPPNELATAENVSI